ncbi:response regulator [Afipia sp. DC4300-2b1]|uniref:response regulator n=1 Tax=Afipia sp. DC4300-2b1 TaxID=2804672 RepID=UPI003CE992F6
MKPSDKHCILIVESDVLVRQPLAEYLRECGYRVIEAVNDAEAREFFAKGVAQVDAVLADVNTSGEARFSLATWIRQNYPGTRVILAGTMATAAQKAGDLCEDGPALSKPYDHRLVLDHIKRMLATRDRK